MAKRKPTVPDCETKWFQRGFESQREYQGWLQFNDLIDESYGYDDTYYDQYSGMTIRVGVQEEIVENDEADKFLRQHEPA